MKTFKEIREEEGQIVPRGKDGQLVKKKGFLAKLSPGKGYRYVKDVGQGLGTVKRGNSGIGMSGRAHGPGLTSTRESVVNESTNWKGSKSIHLTRYAARQGFGVQLTQVKAMPGNRIPVTGLHISMPIKEIPELIKGLQNVYKAKKEAQLGDAD